ncbi:MAG: hypothetical protein R2697_09645 [Ilumatobacteraceae bacterium]
MRIGRVTSRAGGRPEALEEFRSRRCPRRSRRRVRANPRAGHGRRQPGLVEPQLRAARRRTGPRSSSWCRSTRTSTRRPGADVILPPPSALEEKSHYDVALLNFAVHNVAFSPAVVESDADQPGMGDPAALRGLLGGGGANADIGAIDDQIAGAVLGAAITTSTAPCTGAIRQS